MEMMNPIDEVAKDLKIKKLQKGFTPGRIW